MANTVQYYPKEKLALKEAGQGAKMWAVALEQAQLTYFEVEPHSSFELHTHESEQITLVIAGELFFDLDGVKVCARPGDVVAIPSMVPHNVYTGEKPAKAVDAWSPVMKKYSHQA